MIGGNQNILSVTVVEFDVGSMVEASVSFLHPIGMPTDNLVFSEGLETNNFCRF